MIMTKKMIIAASAFMVSAVAFTAFSQNSAGVESPNQVTTEPAIKGETSIIQVPVFIQASDVEALIKQHITQTTFFNQKNIPVADGAKADIQLDRRGDFTVTAADNKMVINIPLKAYVTVDFNKSVFGLAVKDNQKTEVDFTAEATVTPEIKSDYSVDPKLTVQYTIDKPVILEVGPLKLNMASQVKTLLDSQLQKFMPQISALIASKLNVKPYAEQAWALFEKPYLLDKERSLYGWANPQEFQSIPFRTENGSFVAGLGLKGQFFTALRETPPTLTPKPLPPFSTERAQDEFSLNVPFNVTYQDITENLNNNFIGQTLEGDGYKIDFKKFNIYGGENNKIVIGADIKFDRSGKFFDTEGWVYFIGDPAYDSATKTLSVKNLKYDVKSESALINTFAWAATPFITRIIQQKLQYDLSDVIAQIRAEAAQYNPYEVADGAVLESDISQIDIGDIYAGRESLTVNLISKGKFALKLSQNIIKLQ